MQHRAVMIGIDGANYEAIRPLLAEGRLPHLKRLIERGVLCKNALAPYPTLTGSNWATIATGAWPGTHGVTDMSYHVTGEPIDHWHSGFTSDAIEAETIWEAAARQGKKAIVLKYPGSWPPRDERVLMVDGGGGRPFWGGSFLEISHSQMFSTRSFPHSHPLKLQPAEGWKNLPPSTVYPLEAEIDYEGESGNVPEFLYFEGLQTRNSTAIRLYILLLGSREGYDTICLCRTKDAADPICVLHNGEWSDTMIWDFNIGTATVRGGVRVKAQKIDPLAEDIMLYFSQVYPVDGYTQPKSIGEELVRRFGAHVDHTGFTESAMGWFDDESFFELMDYQNRWLGSAARYLMESTEWDLFAMQTHCIDFAAHAWMPRHGWSDEQSSRGWANLARCYESADRLVGEVLDAAGSDAVVCVLSDHGLTPTPGKEVFINPILAEAGLLAFEEGASSSERLRVDWRNTQAAQQRSSFIYVNLDGREPGGIVPSDRYEEVRERIIEALRAYREPETGINPFSLILRKEDAFMLGTFDSLGRDIGDIVYALRPEFDHEHGRQLTTATLDGHTIKPLVIFAGPGIKEGQVLERPTWLIDIVPTICQAAGLSAPTEAEGAILYQIFAGHESKFPRREMLERQQERLSRFTANMRFSESRKAVKPSHQPAHEVVKSEKDRDEQPMPVTVTELQAALRKARQEAEYWKSAYDRYHRITHGN